MSENNDIIDARGTAGYVAKDSDGPAACLDYEGNFDLVIKSIKLNEKSSEAGNRVVSAVLVVQDSDFEGAKGAIIYHSFPISGKVQSGPNKDAENVRVLIDMCNSAGRADLAEQIIGKEFRATPLLAGLQGDGKSAHVYAKLVQQEDDRNGRMKSVPMFYLAKGKAKYDESKATGGVGFRSKPRTAVRKGVGAPSGATAGATAGANTVATDQMASEV